MSASATTDTTSLDDQLRAAHKRVRRARTHAVGRAALAVVTGNNTSGDTSGDTSRARGNGTGRDGWPTGKRAEDYEAEQAARDEPSGWTVREAWNLLWRPARPLAAYAGLLGYTAAWWAAVIEWGVATALPVFVNAVAGAAVMAFGVPKLAKRWDTDKRRVVVGVFVTVAWLLVALVVGPSYELVVAGWLLALALAAGYWQRNRPGYPDDPPAEVEQAPELAELPPVRAGLAADWDTYATTHVPGSWLDFVGTTKYTHDYKLRLPRNGQVTASKVAGKLEELGQALDIMPSKLMVEPESGEDARPTLLDFKYIHTNPVKGVTPYTGPKFENGIVTFANYIDGIGESKVRLYQGGGLWSTFIAGETGSGKSRVTETIAVGAVSDPLNYPTILVYTDPQGGVSSPGLMDGSAHSSSLVDIWPLLTSLVAIAELRQKDTSQNKDIGFRCRPCTCPNQTEAMVSGHHRLDCLYRPGILYILDECHAALQDKRVLAVIEQLARETRKIGIGLILISQNGTLQHGFAGSSVLRSSLLAGNAVCLHTEDKMSSDVLGFEYDTRTLPNEGYLVTKQTVPTNRAVPARCVPPINPDDPSESTAAYWLDQYPTLTLPPVEQEVVDGDWFTSRFAANSDDDDAPSREYIEIRPGNPKVRDYVHSRLDKRLGMSLRKSGDPRPSLPQQTPSGFDPIDIPSFAQLVADVEEAFAGLDVDLTDLTPTTGRPPAAPASTTRLAPGTREYSRQRVYELLAAGHTSSSVGLAEATGWTPQHVRKLLGELADAARVRKTDRGQWEIVR